MAVDYNLVILGDGPVARYAAEYARSLNARVALVTGFSPKVSNAYPTGVYTDHMTIQALRHIAQALPTYIHGPHQVGPLLLPDLPSSQPYDLAKLHWSHLLSLIQTLITGQFEGRSLSALEQLGVDVVYADDCDEAVSSEPPPSSAEFCMDAAVGLQTSRRRLLSQAYLIAVDGEAVVPAIPGIEDVSYTTLDTFLIPSVESQPPTSVLILSNNSQGVEAAYSLGAVGISVTLVMELEYCVEDNNAHQWVNSSLEAIGVKIHWDTSVVRLEQRDRQCVASLKSNDSAANNTEVIADCLLLVLGRQVDFTALQLGTVGVTYDAKGVKVNSHYQSNNAQIFACGDAVDSPPDLNQRYAQVAIAVHHALFDRSVWSNAWLSNLLLRGLKQWLRPSLPPSPPLLPSMVSFSPPLAFIGYSEAEARHRYGASVPDGRSERLTILYESYQILDQAQLLGAHYPHSMAGWCKLLVLDDGQIVGAYVWGMQAEEVIGAIALAMRQSIPLDDLGQLCLSLPSIVAELLQRLGVQWEQERVKRRSLLFDALELAFNWQRDWTGSKK